MTSDQETLEARERAHEQIERLRWLVTLRWVAVVGIAISDLLTQLVGYTRSDSLAGWLVAPLVVGYNLAFLLWLRQIKRRPQTPVARLERELRWNLYLQALCDIVVLTLMVYLNGGIEYPLYYAPLLAIILTGLVLSRTGVFIQANIGAALFAIMAVGEYQGWLPHIPYLAPRYQHLYGDLQAALGSVLSMVGMLNVTAFLISMRSQRARRAEARTRELLRQLRGQVGAAATRLAGETVNIQTAAEEVGHVAEQIATTVQQIAQGAGEQAAQLDRLSHSLEGIAEAGRRVAAGAQETHQAAGQAVLTTDRGRQAARDASARMDEFASAFAQTQKALIELAHRSDEIAEVAAAIDRFAERTDLLALNAGIEAARAGEHGRGFAVVASEVKKLATSSSGSAEQVAEMVGHVREEIAEVVQAVEKNLERVRGGQTAVATLQEVLDGMAEVIAQTDKLAATMERLATQQETAHGEIVRAVGEIASAAEETAAGAEETAAGVEEQTASFAQFSQSAQDLAALAAQLDQSVAGLTNSGNGSHGGARP
jgi:methyl-accepting chemotaxis protein